MGFVEDPQDLNRVVDLQHDYSLIRDTKDVPQTEQHYYFFVFGFRFRVETKFSFSDASKTLEINAGEEEVESSFLRYARTYAPDSLRTSDRPRLFRETVLPALCDAIEYLEMGRLLPRHKLEEWKVVVNFTKRAQ